jgi:hypothetical protein
LDVKLDVKDVKLDANLDVTRRLGRVRQRWNRLQSFTGSRVGDRRHAAGRIRTAGTGLQEQDCRNRTAGTGLQDQDCRNRTAGTGLQEQELPR